MDVWWRSASVCAAMIARSALGTRQPTRSAEPNRPAGSRSRPRRAAQVRPREQAVPSAQGGVVTGEAVERRVLAHVRRD